MGHPLAPIQDTSIFDLRLSRRGRRLNKLCAALCSPQEREWNISSLNSGIYFLVVKVGDELHYAKFVKA